VIAQYLDAITNRPPDQWKSPTIGSLLREVFGETQFGLQFVPMLIGIGWLAKHSKQTREQPWNWADEMPLLLLVSFATASYGAWPFDLVVLLPAVIHVAACLCSPLPSSGRGAGGEGFGRGDAKPLPPVPSPKRGGGANLWLWALAAFVAINAGALAMNLLHVTSDRFVWMAPCLLVAYVLLRPRPGIA
jgi:hypothetical protein